MVYPKDRSFVLHQSEGVLEIQKDSQFSIIEFDDFSTEGISKIELVGPEDATLLIRVKGDKPTDLRGVVIEGRIFFINPNGVILGVSKAESGTIDWEQFLDSAIASQGREAMADKDGTIVVKQKRSP